jgi:hypothetical protein
MVESRGNKWWTLYRVARPVAGARAASLLAGAGLPARRFGTSQLLSGVQPAFRLGRKASVQHPAQQLPCAKHADVQIQKPLRSRWRSTGISLCSMLPLRKMFLSMRETPSCMARSSLGVCMEAEPPVSTACHSFACGVRSACPGAEQLWRWCLVFYRSGRARRKEWESSVSILSEVASFERKQRRQWPPATKRRQPFLPREEGSSSEKGVFA